MPREFEDDEIRQERSRQELYEAGRKAAERGENIDHNPWNPQNFPKEYKAWKKGYENDVTYLEDIIEA